MKTDTVETSKVWRWSLRQEAQSSKSISQIHLEIWPDARTTTNTGAAESRAHNTDVARRLPANWLPTHTHTHAHTASRCGRVPPGEK